MGYLENELSKITSKYEASLKMNANVDTGFLKGSIDVESDKYDVNIEVASYGIYRSPWKNGMNFRDFWEKYYKDEYLETIWDVVSEDVLVELNESFKVKFPNVKIIRY